MSTQPTKLQQTIATYDKIASTYAQKIDSKVTDQLPELNKFVSLIKPNGKVLDVGCAAGRDAAFFHHQGLKVIGIDLSRELLKQGRKLHPEIHTQFMDMTDLKFLPQSFHGIWANASLIHLDRQDVPKTLTGFRRILKSGGICYIRVKQGQGSRGVKEEKSENQVRYTTFFTQPEMKKLLVKAGFIILDSYTYNLQDRNPKSRDIDWVVIFAQKPYQ